jgi:hypothetical protein
MSLAKNMTEKEKEEFRKEILEIHREIDELMKKYPVTECRLGEPEYFVDDKKKESREPTLLKLIWI